MCVALNNILFTFACFELYENGNELYESGYNLL